MASVGALLLGILNVAIVVALLILLGLIIQWLLSWLPSLRILGAS